MRNSLLYVTSLSVGPPLRGAGPMPSIVGERERASWNKQMLILNESFSMHYVDVHGSKIATFATALLHNPCRLRASWRSLSMVSDKLSAKARK